MAESNFSQQIEHLLFTGSIKGDEILKLHHLLKSYKQGKISSHDMQAAIAAFDPEQYLELWGTDD